MREVSTPLLFRYPLRLSFEPLELICPPDKCERFFEALLESELLTGQVRITQQPAQRICNS